MKVVDEKLEAVPKFCYLEGILSAGGGCKLAVIINTLQMCFGASSANCSPFHPQSSTSDQRSSLFNMRKECDATYSRDLGPVSDYTEPPAAL